jgi:hypothetical protein
MESPIADLDETQGDAQLALRLLRQESRAVQAEGWHWNTDENLKLLPDINGEVVLPARDPQGRHRRESQIHDLAQRAGKLYARQKATFNITSLASYVFVDIVQQFAFETLPESARQYIKVRAGRKFLARTVGTQDRVGYEANDEKIARAVLEAEEEANADRSVLDNPDYARLSYCRRPNLWP